VWFVFDSVYEANDSLLGPFELFQLTEALETEDSPSMPTFPIGIAYLKE